MGFILTELIEALCPDGVVYKRIGDIAEVGTGSSNGNEAVDNGVYPFFVRSQTIKAKDDYEYDEEAIIIPGEGGIGEIFHYVNGKYALHQRVYRIHFLTKDVNVKFAYYYMQANFKSFILKKAVSATVTSIRKPMVEGFPLPMPPLPVQSEIVRILDNFTELTTELAAELTARKQQYEYYRENILNFENAPLERLGDICTIERGIRVVRGDLNEDSGVPVYQNSVVPLGYHTQANRNANTPFVIGAGAAGQIGFSYENYWAADDCYTFAENTRINNRYLYFVLQKNSYQIASQVRRASIPRLPRVALENLKIAVPPLEEQERIVSILDRFDTLCNDITNGLPAEIEARQKQYEYYRDKLLTFKERVD